MFQVLGKRVREDLYVKGGILTVFVGTEVVSGTALIDNLKN